MRVLFLFFGNWLDMLPSVLNVYKHVKAKIADVIWKCESKAAEQKVVQKIIFIPILFRFFIIYLFPFLIVFMFVLNTIYFWNSVKAQNSYGIESF